MRPGDLDDTAPPEPDEILLEQVHSRSVSFRKRRSVQRFGSVVSVVLVLALAGIALVRFDGSDGNKVTIVPPSTSTTTPAEVTTEMLIGEWRPATIADYGGPLTSPPLSRPPLIRFTSARDWTGSDGCNGQGGTYGLGAYGAIHFDMPYSEAMLCPQKTPQLDLLPTATRVEIHDDRLTFFGPDGELATYARRDVTARIVLPSTTMIAGSSMEGHVVVENNTGGALHVVGCGSWFQVVLDNAESEPIVPWRDCRQQFTIPVGTSTYPARIAASYLGCNSPPPSSPPGCPPLPAGTYQATMFEEEAVVPTPPPITVHVVEAGTDSTDQASVAGLKAAALAWSKAFLTGTPDDIFAMQGPECTQDMGTTPSKALVISYLDGMRATMKQHFGVPLDAITNHGVQVRNFTDTSGKALVLYDLPESKTGNDNWVTYARHDGQWKVADCHAPIGGSSSSLKSSAPQTAP